MAWYDQHRERFALEARLLKRAYPEAKLVKKGGLMRVWLRIRGRLRVYESELIYPLRFPFEPMKAYMLSPRIDSKFHQFNDGRLCLHEPEDVGPQTTAIVYIGWLNGWIDRYEKSLRTGKWRD